jgi:hypothetical protein
MHKLVRSIVSVVACRLRSRAVLELENSPYVINCTFFSGSGRVGPGCSRSTAGSGSGCPSKKFHLSPNLSSGEKSIIELMGLANRVAI